jgi:hypothetical protein
MLAGKVLIFDSKVKYSSTEHFMRYSTLLVSGTRALFFGFEVVCLIKRFISWEGKNKFRTLLIKQPA